MNILELFRTFQTQEQAVEHLEKVRWRGHPVCPYCKGERVYRHASGDRKGQRWQCQDCSRAFAVTVGTIFHGTHVPLKNWLLVLALMLKAKKSASSPQIARDLGMRQPTVWSMMHRVRTAMQTDVDQATFLQGIVEADETHFGGNPPGGNRAADTKPNKRGRGTTKAATLGIIGHGDRVVTKPPKKGNLPSARLVKLILHFVDPAKHISKKNRRYNLINSTLLLNSMVMA